MTNFTMLKNVSSMKYALKSVSGPMGMGLAQEVHPDGWMGQEKV